MTLAEWFEERGRTKGRKQGREEGREEGERQATRKIALLRCFVTALIVRWSVKPPGL